MRNHSMQPSEGNATPLDGVEESINGCIVTVNYKTEGSNCCDLDGLLASLLDSFSRTTSPASDAIAPLH